LTAGAKPEAEGRVRAVLQRVASARVAVGGETKGEIGHGLAILLGVADGDGEDEARWLATKVRELRIFEDDAGKMNLSLIDVEGGALVVSQFTLLADCRKGRRPSFTGAAAPDLGEALYERFVELLRSDGVPVATGVFGARMLVSIENEGPVTIIVDTDDRQRSRRGGTAPGEEG
jgi:D-tyrosyl-tRNA(Tyr) deacylase